MSEWRYYELGERKVPGVDATYLALKPVEHAEYYYHVVAVIRWDDSGKVSVVHERGWAEPGEALGEREIRQAYVPLPEQLAHLELDLVPTETVYF